MYNVSRFWLHTATNDRNENRVPSFISVCETEIILTLNKQCVGVLRLPDGGFHFLDISEATKCRVPNLLKRRPFKVEGVRPQKLNFSFSFSKIVGYTGFASVFL